jgi:plastocyanin
VFNYAGGAPTVDEVSASDYAACSSSKALSSDSTGTTTVTLKTSGKHYFICGVTGHCSGGMKLVVGRVPALLPTSSSLPPVGQ